MLKKIVCTVLLIVVSLYGISQKDINNYKYILIPKKFDFSKSEDQYQLNSLTKFLFNKYGYEAYFIDDTLPKDLQNDRCLALTSELLKDKSGMFKTKLKFTLKDCFGSVILTSKMGESRLKDYNKAYTEALRNAFNTFKNITYKYQPITDFKDDSLSKSKAKKSEVKPIENPKIQSEIIKKDKEVIAKKIEEDNKEFYNAQLMKDGYQLVAHKSKQIIVLFNTTAKNVFLVKGKDAIVYKEGDLWIYYEHNNTDKIKKELHIKF